MQKRLLAMLVAAACSGSDPGPGGSGGGGSSGGGGGGGGVQLEPGTACTGEYGCWHRDAGTLLACEPLDAGNRTLVAYPCRGFGGCTSNASITRCEFVGALKGDPCPEKHRGNGFCSDGGIMVCRDGGWTESPCPNCREQSGQLFCN